MEYKRLIIAMITEIKEEDVRFLKRIYTLVKKHIERIGIDTKEELSN